MNFLKIDELYYKYEDTWILEDISFEGNKGELIAIVGPSGCGKTTLLKVLVGILTPQKGSVFLETQNIIGFPIEKRMIGYVPQNQALFPHLTVSDNISFGLKAQKWRKDLIEERVTELINLGELQDLRHRRPHELSGGQQQRVALLRALAPSPKLLLLDEPLSNVDAQLREQLAIYIKDIQQMSSITTLFVTHDLNEAKMLADKLVLLKNGKILQIGTPINLSSNPNTLEVAQTLGFKNIFKIFSISDIKTNQLIQVSTELGILNIPISLFPSSNKKPEGLYIDPIGIKLSKDFITDVNSFNGKIIAIIPEPMLNQSSLLIRIFLKRSFQGDKVQIINEVKHPIIRVQVPSLKPKYQMSEEVSVKILYSALKFQF